MIRWPFYRSKTSRHALQIGGDNPGIAISGNVKGDVIIHQNRRHPITRLNIPWEKTPDPKNIAAMLKWNSRIPARLIGRDREMAELLQWADSDSVFKLRILHGEGGVGKTRFGFELADRLRKQGWNAGAMAELDSSCTYELGKKGLLLIIDYPEEQGGAIKKLVNDLARLELPPKTRLRILLLSRRPELPELPGKLEANYDPPFELSPLGQGEEFAWELFSAGLAAMQKLQSGSEKQLLDREQFQEWLGSNPLHNRPLFLLAFARNLLEAPGQARLQGPAVIEALVRRESRRLRDEAEAKGLDGDGVLLLKSLAAVTGPIDRPMLEKLRSVPDPEISLPPFGRVLTGSTLWDRNNKAITPLQPDLLAAWLLQSELAGDHLQGGKWLYQAVTPKDKNSQKQALQRLIRLLADGRFILDRAETTLMAALVDYVQEQPERCNALEVLVDMEQPTLFLLPLAITVTRHWLENCDDPVEEARILNNLSVDLAESGERAEGLAAIKRSVEIREQLAAENFAAYAPDLAGGLGNLSNRLAEAGDLAGAISNLERAITLIQDFAIPNTTHGDWHQGMLHNLAKFKKRMAENS